MAMNISPSMFREVRRLLWIHFMDPILDGIDAWAYRLGTNGGAGTRPKGEVHITQGADW